jgi:luciferase family oxidoreductase group 1
MSDSTLKLSVLDQSPVRKGSSPTQALEESIQLAQHTERLGYERFWVSEHHSTDMLAGTSPEVFLGALGSRTNSIRIGSGGVMLPHYSPFKVAENFAVLDALYPNRIDLGIGRAPGSDMSTARALARDGRPRFGDFADQARELYERVMLKQGSPNVTPRSFGHPDVWMLGSSPDSAKLAAELGLPYNVAVFINDKVPSNVIRLYKDRFKPSEKFAEPKATIAVHTICAETTEKAEFIARSIDVAFIKFLTKSGDPRIPPADEANQYVFTPRERAFIQSRSGNRAVGDPITVQHQLIELAETFDADEIMAVTITHDFDDRLRSYELLAQQFQLEQRSAA